MRAGSFNLDVGKFKGSLILQCKLDHCQPIIERTDGPIHFMRRNRRQHPEQTRQLELDMGFGSQNQMSEMRRIKRSAEDTDPFRPKESISF